MEAEQLAREMAQRQEDLLQAKAKMQADIAAEANKFAAAQVRLYA